MLFFNWPKGTVNHSVTTSFYDSRMSANDAAKLFREKADSYLEMTRYVRDEQKRRVLDELVEENEAKADLLERVMLTQESFSNFHADIAAVGHNMIEDNLEILVKPASWQNPGMPERWNWQVRQKHPSKFMVKGVTAGSIERAQAAADAARARILEKANGLVDPGCCKTARGRPDRTIL